VPDDTINAFMKEYIPILTALIGALAGWLISRYQLRRQESREKKKLILQKLEELYEALSGFVEGLATIIHRTARANLEALASKFIPKHLLPSKPAIEGKIVSEDRIRVLVGFYAPELSDDWNKIEAASGDFCEMMFRSTAQGLLATGEDDRDGEQSVEGGLPVFAQLDQLENVYRMCEEMKKRVVEISEKYR